MRSWLGGIVLLGLVGTLGYMLPKGADAMRSFLAISPQDYDVASAFVAAQFRDEAPVAPLETIFGARAEYDLRALDTMAKLTRRDFDAHGRVLERQCALVPGHCFDSGHHHLEKGEIAAAAAAYERGLELAADRVMAANNSLWLMNHYLDVGETGRARAVAEEAGETGSYGGLLTRSRFLERTGDFAGAERILRSARERYGNRPQNPDEREESKDGEQDEDDLVGFYYRMAFARGQREYEARFRELTEDDFPHGLEKVDRASLTGFPSDGVFVLRAFPQAERAGLRTGDIIVGLDGHRIRTRRQYYLVRSFTDSLDVSLVVFRHPGYLELKARAPGRRLGIEMRSHKPVSAAPTD